MRVRCPNDETTLFTSVRLFWICTCFCVKIRFESLFYEKVSNLRSVSNKYGKCVVEFKLERGLAYANNTQWRCYIKKLFHKTFYENNTIKLLTKRVLDLNFICLLF